MRLYVDKANELKGVVEHFDICSNPKDADVILMEYDINCDGGYKHSDIADNQYLVLAYKSTENIDVKFRLNTTLFEYKDNIDFEVVAASELLSVKQMISKNETEFFEHLVPYLQVIAPITEGKNLEIQYETLARYESYGNSLFGPDSIFSFADPSFYLDVFEHFLCKLSNEIQEKIITINLPKIVFIDSVLFNRLIVILNCCDVSKRDNLIIEITESNAIGILSRNKIKLLSTFVRAIYLDDFGSLNSNFDFYNSINVQNLGIKIDKNLFWDMSRKGRKCFIEESEALLRLLEDCHVFIFEGVETETQLNYVKSLASVSSKNIYAQGFFISRPKKLSLQSCLLNEI